MKYAHVDSNNKLLGWYTRDIHDVIPENCIEVSDEQWKKALNQNATHVYPDGTFEHISIEISLSEKENQARSKRNNILKEEVDSLVTNPLRWAELTAEQQKCIAQYRLDLLNVPQQKTFPDDIIWPTKPEFLKG